MLLTWNSIAVIYNTWLFSQSDIVKDLQLYSTSLTVVVADVDIQIYHELVLTWEIIYLVSKDYENVGLDSDGQQF